jgi:hypothetical protein
MRRNMNTRRGVVFCGSGCKIPEVFRPHTSHRRTNRQSLAVAAGGIRGPPVRRGDPTAATSATRPGRPQSRPVARPRSRPRRTITSATSISARASPKEARVQFPIGSHCSAVRRAVERRGCYGAATQDTPQLEELDRAGSSERAFARQPVPAALTFPARPPILREGSSISCNDLFSGCERVNPGLNVDASHRRRV